MSKKNIKLSRNLEGMIYFILGLGLGMLIASSVKAETTVYTWEADEVVCYTNDEKRIPEKYQGVAETIIVDGMETYPKYTPITPSGDPMEE